MIYQQTGQIVNLDDGQIESFQLENQEDIRVMFNNVNDNYGL